MTCKLCSNEHLTKIEDIQMKNTYYQCKNCDFIFSKNLPNIEQEQQQYSNHNNSIENEGYVQMFQDFINFAITPFTDKTKPLLEFGSGPGPVLSHLLKQKDFNVQIYDPIYANDCSWKHKKFNTIISTEVFEHLHKPKESIKELLNSLDAGGTLAFQTIFHPQNEEKFLKWWYRRDPTHVGFFSHITLEKMQDVFDLELLKFDEKNIAVFKKL